MRMTKKEIANQFALNTISEIPAEVSTWVIRQFTKSELYSDQVKLRILREFLADKKSVCALLD